MKPFLTSFFSLSLILSTTAAPPSVLDLFPPSGLEFSSSSKTPDSSCEFKFSPAGSKWIDGIHEEDVFLASLKGDGWVLGVGKGGHIYSLRGPYGESVPPQRVESPWNDEVWQAVATNEEIITPIHDYQNKDPKTRYAASEPLMYFIHQAGIYTPGADENDSGKKKAFYSPCLRKDWNPETKTLRLVNWMQQAHTPCVWKSGILIYTAFTDLGDGVLEVNQILHNFGEERLNYFSLPWGGVRKTSLPETLISRKDGSAKLEKGYWDWTDVPNIHLQESGGWELWTQDHKDEKAPSLGFVFGQALHYKKEHEEDKTLILWGEAGDNSPRDYQVTEISYQDYWVNPGSSLTSRWYLVSNALKKTKELSKKLVKNTSLDVHRFTSSPLQSLHVDNATLNTQGKGKEVAKLLAFPVEGTVPVFLLRDKRTGMQIVTRDLYALAETEPFPNPIPKDNPIHKLYENRVIYKQYAPHIIYEDLLGYAYPEKPTTGDPSPFTLPEDVETHESLGDLWITKGE